MKTLILFAIATAMLAQVAQEKFVVEKLTDAEVLSLDKTDAAVSAAAEKLLAAQKEMDAAKTARDKAVNVITQRFGAFDGSCGGSWVTAEIRYRKVRKVELRGRYALITNSEEPCSSIAFVPATGTLVPNNSVLQYDGTEWGTIGAGDLASSDLHTVLNPER